MKFLTKPTIFTQVLSSKAYVYASTLLLLTCLLSYAFALGSFSFSLMYFTVFVALGGMAFALSGTFLKLGSFAFLLGRNKKVYLVQNKENKIKCYKMV